MTFSLMTKFILAAWLATVIIPNLVMAADSPDPYANETTAQRDARMQWWREARFGMFIHWGVYSVPAGTYEGRQIPSIGEWIMCNGKIPMATYQTYAKEFNPVKYNPDDWVRLAKAAGMKYIVITTKHHDGFAMFKTQASPWNIVQASPYGKDVLKPLAAACRKYGIKLGFYYSQAQDWNNGGSECAGAWDPAQKHDMGEYINQVAVPQVRELLSNYGEFPAVLWWDTDCDINRERGAKLEALLKLKPGIITNNRLGGGFQGDTETPEQFVPATGFNGRDWETCMTMNDTWGYKSYDHNWKSTETIIQNLVDIASKGGNYLLNVGPTSEGLIPEPSIERLKAVGAWMKVNGDAIYDTTASPFKKLPWGRCTKRITGGDTTLFLHVFNWPADGKLVVPGLKNAVTASRLMATGEKLSFRQNDDGVVVDLPAVAPDSISTTVVLQIHGTPEVEPTFLSQSPDGSIQLPASVADLHGALQYEMGSGNDNIGFWTNPADTADWTFKVEHAGQFKVIADIAAVDAGKFQVIVDGQKLQAAVPITKDYTKFQTVTLDGTLEIEKPGIVTVTVKPVADGWNPMNLRSLRLTPLAQ
jgi:alpha-L-fucosidase